MRGLHVIAGLDPRHGGPSYSVPRLCGALREQGVDVRILTVGEKSVPQDPFVVPHPQDFANVPFLRAMRLSSRLTKAIRMVASTTDFFHVHGLWLMPNVSVGHAVATAGRPLIVSPRGMLGPGALAFSSKKKRMFWRFFQGPAYARAAAWHATSESEAAEIRAFGIRAPVAIIPNGIDLPQESAGLRSTSKERTILYLGRLHPIKGLPNLISAWARLAAERPGWSVCIVGPDECSHRADLEGMAARLGAPRIAFGDPVYGEKKAQMLRDADLFVLPTRSENFGLSVAEALAAGVPAIVSHGAPWGGLKTERCGWWVERGDEAFLTALRTATELPDAERYEMGRRGRAWMARDFGWNAVADKTLKLYAWTAKRGPLPDFVSLC